MSNQVAISGAVLLVYRQQASPAVPLPPPVLPGSEVWAWLSSGGSEGAAEKQLAKGWTEVRL